MVLFDPLSDSVGSHGLSAVNPGNGVESVEVMTLLQVRQDVLREGGPERGPVGVPIRVAVGSIDQSLVRSIGGVNTLTVALLAIELRDQLVSIIEHLIVQRIILLTLVVGVWDASIRRRELVVEILYVRSLSALSQRVDSS